MLCKSCSSQIPDGTTNCPYCGAIQATAQPVQQYPPYQQPQQQYQYQQPYQQVQPVQQPAPNHQTRIVPGFMILSILVPVFGIVFGIINLCKKNTRPGRAYLIAGGVTFVVICTIYSIIFAAAFSSTSYYYSYYY